MKEGLENFDPHNVLEYLLYFSIPSGDVNPLAHRLMDHFGSLSAVLDAPYEELVKVKGVGNHTALLLKLIPEISRWYQMDKAREVILSTSEEVGRFLLPRYLGRQTETVYLLCFDNKGKLVGSQILFKGSINAAAVSVRLIVQAALKFNATQVVISHNHPGGVALPSEDDMATTRRIAEALNAVGIALADHIIVADDDFVSLKDSGFL